MEDGCDRATIKAQLLPVLGPRAMSGLSFSQPSSASTVVECLLLAPDQQKAFIRAAIRRAG
jgi:hypothetical protein